MVPTCRISQAILIHLSLTSPHLPPPAHCCLDLHIFWPLVVSLVRHNNCSLFSSLSVQTNKRVNNQHKQLNKQQCVQMNNVTSVPASSASISKCQAVSDYEVKCQHSCLNILHSCPAIFLRSYMATVSTQQEVTATNRETILKPNQTK